VILLTIENFLELQKMNFNFTPPKNIFSIHKDKLPIDISIIEELEQRKICKKENNYYLVRTDILFQGFEEASDSAEYVKLQAFFEMAKSRDFGYIQIILEDEQTTQTTN
jgi:hypothetical protein